MKEFTHLTMSPEDTVTAVATLEDVAQRAGVSTATVSRCLNSPKKVSEQTRERVMSVVRELGYSPNFGARALAAKRTNTFGAIVPTMENAIFARGLQAFQEELRTHGVTLLVASSSYRPDIEEEQVRALVARGADALLLIGYDRPPQTYAFLERRDIPYVVAWAHDQSVRHTSIGFENRRAMQELADRLIELGHRSIGLITAPRDGNDRARERYEGVVSAMKHRGLDPQTLHIVETPYSIANGADAFSDLMGSGTGITAVMCGNDVLAAGAISMAKKMGVRVPQDVSITGFDDLELAEIVSPGLTTIHVPHREMGQGAARLLVDMRNGGQPGQKIRLQAAIKWRDSLGPVAG